MPIDPRIALGVQAPQFESPTNLLAQALSVQNLQRQGQMGQMQMQAAQQDYEETNKLRQLLSTPGFDRMAPGAANQVLGIAPVKGQGIIKGWADADKSAADVSETKTKTAKAQFELAHSKSQALLDAVSGATDQGSYENAVKTAAALGADVSNVPAVYDPKVVSQFGQAALTAKERLEAQMKQMGFTVTMRGQDMTRATSLETNAATNATSRANNAATVGATYRGQNMTDARARETLAANGPKPTYDTERGIVVDTRAGTSSPVLDAAGKPIGPKKSPELATKVTDAKDVLSMLDDADSLLKTATGSMVGAGVDRALGMVGKSTSGAQSTAQLKALEGALVSKMPKMSGPQSDKDVLLYRQMAGQIADDTLPIGTRQAAISQVRRIQEKYAGVEQGSTGGAPKKIADQAAFDALPSGAEFIAPDGSHRRKP